MSNDGPQNELPKRPLAAIFMSPRKAIRGIVSTNAAYGVTALTAVAGITALFSFASSFSLGDTLSTIGVIAVAVALGLPVGVVMMWLMTATTRETGRWLKGTATHEQLKSAIVWGNAPAVFEIPVILTGCALYGNEYFSSARPTMRSFAQLPTVIALGFVGFAIAVWTIILSSQTIAEVQGFRSAWMGFLNLLLASLVLAFIGVGLGVVALMALLAIYGTMH